MNTVIMDTILSTVDGEFDNDKMAVELAILDAFRAGDMDRLSGLVPSDNAEINSDNRFLKATVQ